MSSTDSPSDSVALDVPTTATLEELLAEIITAAHVRQIGHLLVTRTPPIEAGGLETSNQDRFFAPDHQCPPVLAPPQHNASTDKHRAYARQEALTTNMTAAILSKLKALFRYVYDDAISECGGANRIYLLTLPRLVAVILREVDVTSESRERLLKDLVGTAALDLQQPLPLRHYSTRITTWLAELRAIGYEYAPSDLLQIITTCLKPHAVNSPPLSAQLDKFAELARPDRTGPRLLTTLVEYERARQRQGLSILEPTAGSEHYAAKASSVPITSGGTLARFMAAYKDPAISTTQRAILEKHLEAALATMTFAAEHPEHPPKMLTNHFCPLHSWQPSHPETNCHAINGTLPPKRDPASSKKTDGTAKSKPT
jgi:hypothetical protein